MGGVGWRASGRPAEVRTEIFNEKMYSMRSNPWEGWDGGHQAGLQRSEQRYLIKNVFHEAQLMGVVGWRPSGRPI
jgi:hypothetical protein